MSPRFLVLLLALIVVPAALAQSVPGTRSGSITTSDGVRLHYLEAGRGPAVLFVPGWTMPAWIWEHQIRHFSKTHRVVAMDPRSQGESDKPAEGHYPERRAQDIKEVVDQLKLAPVVIVGWSLAVPETLTYVREFGTSSLMGVVLVDGMIGMDRNPQMEAGMWMWMKGMQRDRRTHADQFVRSMYKKPQSAEYLKRVVDAALQTPTNSAFTLLGNVFSGGDWRPVVARLDKPVLFVGTPQLKPQGDFVKSKLPEATVEIFADAGHALFVDEAERFNALLEKFLQSCH